MIKMERTCGSLRCDVIQNGKKIGRMDGVNVTQWFLKNKYRYTGTFSRFLSNKPEDNYTGARIDIIFNDKKIVVKDAEIEWIKNTTKNGTFHAAGIESLH
ncbi:MAG: hypothetical protein KO217_03560 [Methanobacteriaceae archaeon]|jgi:hypothetical protein|nr:MAG: hypothetical protein CIT01_03965 [Methanobacterium sp. BRmetb2]MCC7557754.1 hypothetical protein [Methanobacteriaceae archaeon]